VEDAVAERHDNIRIKVVLAVTFWVRALTDGLGIIAPVARVIRSNPRPSLLLVLNIIASLKELEPTLARREGMVPSIADYPIEQARILNRKQVLLVPA
jgi:hypothetical protein